MTRVGTVSKPYLNGLLGQLVLVVALCATAFSQTQPFTSGLQFREIEPGIEYGQIASGVASKDEKTGPWLINVLRVDLRKTAVKIVRALDIGVGTETVSSLVARHGATAGINGGYFRTGGTYRGESLGFLLVDHKLFSEPHNNRAEVGLIANGATTDLVFGHLVFRAEVSIGKTVKSIPGLNRQLAANELIVFTPEFHRTTLTNPDVMEVVVRRNRVNSISSKGSSSIPPDGFVISATGTERQWLKRHARIGAMARFSWRINSLKSADDKNWRSAYSIVGGGPQLISEGEIDIRRDQEKITEAFVSERHPRTAIGRDKSGRLLLVTVDGRQPNISVGMSLPSLAQLLLELHATDAINLDGGGSTTMVVGDKIVNRPSDSAGERPVSDAILVFPKRN